MKINSEQVNKWVNYYNSKNSKINSPNFIHYFEPDKSKCSMVLQYEKLEDKKYEYYKELEDKKLEDKKLEDKKLEDKKLEDKKLEDKKLEDKKLEDKKLEDKKLEDNCKTKEYYYGLHPSISSHLAVSSIIKWNLSNKSKLDEFLYNHRKCFTLPCSNYCLLKQDVKTEYFKSLFALAVLKMCTNYCIKLTIENKAKIILDKLIADSKNKSIFIKKVTYDLDDNVFTFIGVITDEMIQIFFDNNLYINNKKIIEIKSYTLEEKNDFLKNIPPDFISYIGTDEYYSGVLPRLVRISYEENSANSEITTYIFHVQRSTYAMTDCFDNILILKHPLLREYKSIYNDFFKTEDELRENIYKELKPEKTVKEKIDILNEKYLNNSTGTNSIGISGNIVTKDNRLIIAFRGKNSIDSNEFYCSVNGQSEIIDQNVSFYKNSASVDFPSIDINSKYRLDFEQELFRETRAELNLPLFNNWIYYGFSILGINPSKKIDYDNLIPDLDDEGNIIEVNNEEDNIKLNKRRMHFNVLAFNTTEKELKDIVELRESAIEKFESSNIIGIKVSLYSNKKSYFFSFFFKFVKLISKYNTELLYVYTFLLLIINRNIFNLDGELVLGIFVALTFIFNIVFHFKEYKKYLKNRKNIKTCMNNFTYIFDKNIKQNSSESMEFDKLKKILIKKDLDKFNPICTLMFYLYFSSLKAENLLKD